MDDWLLFGGALALGYVIWFLFYLKLYPSKKPCLHCDALTDEPEKVKLFAKLQRDGQK